MKTIFDIAEQLAAEVPEYKDRMEYAGESFILFEVRFDMAVVTKDLDSIKTIKLQMEKLPESKKEEIGMMCAT